MEYRRYVKSTSRGKPRVWEITRDRDTLLYRHGVLGGKLTESSDRVQPKGRPGSSSYRNGLQQAELEEARMIRLKVEEGYREEVAGEVETVASSSEDLDWERAEIPKNFAWYKCSKSEKIVGPERLRERTKLLAGQPIFTIKENGYATAFISSSSGTSYNLYSTRRDKVTDRYLYHEVFFCHLASLFPKSLILGEMVLEDSEGRQSLRKMSSIARSLPDRAKEQQDLLGLPKFIIWGVLFFRGQDCSAWVAQKRLQATQAIFARWEQELGPLLLEYARGIEILDISKEPEPRSIPEELVSFGSAELHERGEALLKARRVAERRQVEGLVVYDGEATWGDLSYNFRGKPDRVQAWKVKFEQEVDLIAIFDPLGVKHPGFEKRGKFGRGDRQGKVGSLSLYELLPRKDGSGWEYSYVGEVGSGLTDEQVEELSNPDLYPLVVEVKYAERNEDTRALVHPVFLRTRPDKSPGECIADD